MKQAKRWQAKELKWLFAMPLLLVLYALCWNYYGMSSPEANWNALLKATQEKDESSIMRLTTSRGLGSLIHQYPVPNELSEQKLNELQQWSNDWASAKLVIKEQSWWKTEAGAMMPGETSVTFKRTLKGWEFDWWEGGS